MTLQHLLDHWRQRREIYAADGALVSGTKVAEQVIQDLELAIHSSAKNDLVTLSEAARLSGFSADYLRRLVRNGQLEDFGKPHKPLVFVESLPRKAGCLLNQPEDANISEPKRRVALSVLHPAA